MLIERIIELLKQLLYDFFKILPSILGAIIVFIIGYIIAKLVAYVIKKVLKSIQIDKFAERLNEIDFISKSNFNIVPSLILSKIAYYVILLVFGIVSTEILNFDAVSELVSNLVSYIPHVIAAIIVLFIGLLIADLLKGIVVTAAKSMGIPSASIIGGAVFYFVFLMTLITAIKQIGIEADFIETNLSYIIGGGVMAFAIGYGLASKDMMSNFLASFYSKDKFHTGDTIAINGFKGIIEEMGSSSITLRSKENHKIIIPLSKLTAENVEVFED